MSSWSGRVIQVSRMTKCLVVMAIVAAVCGCSKPASEAGNEATLDDLNRALSAMSMRSGGVPSSPSELTNFPTLRGKSLPKAPAGKRLVIDRQAKQVIFADQ
jgi:hypothetical protein